MNFTAVRRFFLYKKRKYTEKIVFAKARKFSQIIAVNVRKMYPEIKKSRCKTVKKKFLQRKKHLLLQMLLQW